MTRHRNDPGLAPRGKLRIIGTHQVWIQAGLLDTAIETVAVDIVRKCRRQRRQCEPEQHAAGNNQPESGAAVDGMLEGVKSGKINDAGHERQSNKIDYVKLEIAKPAHPEEQGLQQA